MFIAKIYITLKKGILDPQGKAVNNALHSIGYSQVKDVRVGKYIELAVEGSDIKNIEQSVNEMCIKILTNPIIEDYTFDIMEG
ncbi:MAG: phosphoribosylformylglycinamidine synthase subunit PurS [Thermoanaerobacteraceae bacterium]